MSAPVGAPRPGVPGSKFAPRQIVAPECLRVAARRLCNTCAVDLRVTLRRVDARRVTSGEQEDVNGEPIEAGARVDDGKPDVQRLLLPKGKCLPVPTDGYDIVAEEKKA